jgi:hypothetical protein
MGNSLVLTLVRAAAKVPEAEEDEDEDVVGERAAAVLATAAAGG